MKMLKVHNGYVSLDKITGIHLEKRSSVLPLPVTVTTVGGDKYGFSEGYMPTDDDARDGFSSVASQERIRAYIARYLMENTVDLDDVIQKASKKDCGMSCGHSHSCGFSHGFTQGGSLSFGDGKTATFSQTQSSSSNGAERAYEAARARHEEFKKKAEENRRKFDERDARNREKMKEFADVIDAIKNAFENADVHVRRF